MIKEKHSIGDRIRQLREARKLSVQDLAQRSQAHPKLIEELEAGELVSSLAPLLKIARGLGTRLESLLDDAPTDGPVVTRAGEAEEAVEFSGQGPYCMSTLDFYPLARNKKDRHMEPFVVVVHPSVPEECTFSFHEGEEFIFVMSGSIEVCHGSASYVLTPGDSIYYESTTPHQVQAAGDADARILAVLYT